VWLWSEGFLRSGPGKPRGRNTVDESHAVADLMRERAWKKVIWSLRHFNATCCTALPQASVEFVPFPVDYAWIQSPLARYSTSAISDGLRETQGALRDYGPAFYAVYRR